MEIPENTSWVGYKVPTLAKVKDKNFTLYIGRENKWLGLEGSKWGNPFHLKRESDRESILKQHEEYLEDNEELIAALPELGGHILGCYCFTGELVDGEWKGHGKKCHGMNLIKAYIKYVQQSKSQ